MAPEQIAEAVVAAATAAGTGTCWVCQPGREPLPYEFRDVPGPRTKGARVAARPMLRRGRRYHRVSSVQAANCGGRRRPRSLSWVGPRVRAYPRRSSEFE